MKMVNAAELKAHLGKYLGMVKEGETVYVTSHRRPVAQLAPSHVDDSLMVERPTLTMDRLKSVVGIQVASGADALKELLADRQRR